MQPEEITDRSQRRRLLTLLVVLVCTVAVGIWVNQGAPSELERLKPIVAGVGQATQTVLYEGLPHQMFERDALNQELETNATSDLHGHPFYRDTLTPTDDDARRLKLLFCAPGSFTARRRDVDKACGGFHPDYCIEWQNAGEVFHVLVCFGCGEVKCFGNGREVYCDMPASTEGEFGSIVRT